MYRFCSLAITLVFVAGCSVVPNPFEEREIADQIEADQAVLRDSQEPLGTILTMSEAMARAVSYNLDHRVQMMQTAVANGQFELAKFDMLPTLAASAGFNYRNPEDASISETIRSGIQSNEPSTSSDKFRGIADLRLSWNILDFGVSYLQAKQEADRFLIAREARNKLLGNMLLQVRTTYWRALAAQRLRPRIAAIRGRAEAMLAQVEQGINAGVFVDNRGALLTQKSLLTVIQQLEAAEQRLLVSQLQLASLINERPNSTIELFDPGELPALPVPPDDIEILEEIALGNSGDYREQLYNTRIERLEARKALLRLLPGLEFGLSGNFDSNSFLEYNNWYEASTTVTWNLLRVAAYPETKELNEARSSLTDATRLAVNMAVITQIHVSSRRYVDSIERLQRAQELLLLDQRIAALSQGAQAAQIGGAVDTLQAEVDALRSEMDNMIAYADAQEALGTLIVSIGFDPVPDDFQSMTISDLTSSIQTNNQRIQSGDWVLDVLTSYLERQAHEVL